MHSIFHLSIGGSIQELTEKLGSWLDSIILNLPNFILALLLFIGSVMLSRYVYRLIIRVMARQNIDTSIQFTTARLLRATIIGIGFFLALGVLNLDKVLTSILASVGILGLAVSFALQGTLRNTISGFILSFMPEIKTGDWIETKGFAGEIIEVNLRNIIIKESDNNYVVIPNAQIAESPFKNFSSTNRSRIVIKTRVPLDADLPLTEKLIKKAIADVYQQDAHEEVEVYYEEFGAESINLVVRFWADVKRMRQIRIARHKGIQIIKNVFEENGIHIPIPKRSLDVTEHNQLSKQPKTPK